MSRVVLVVLLSCLSVTAQAGSRCPEGQVRTGGSCCWPMQTWDAGRGLCTGAPRCPATHDAQGTSCILAGSAGCATGEVKVSDHCCWPGQRWSRSQARCKDRPLSCPPGLAPEADGCGPGSPVCPAGQALSADTAGHCCWPGQAWSGARQTCVGLPQCPTGTQASGERCVAAAPTCAPGQAISADTAGHCCWPGQVWSGSRQLCIGLPQCPAGWLAQGEACLRSSPTGQ